MLVKELIAEGLIDEPWLILLCTGIPYGAPDDPLTLLTMVNQLPPGAIFSTFSIGRMQPFVAMAALVGGNVRVGLEDNVYLARGRLATHGELVERAVRILEAMNVRVLGRRGTREAPPAQDGMRARAGDVRNVGLLGGGVIGAGWAARFLLNGVGVCLYDPDPNTPRKVAEMLANARRALARLTLAPLPAEGALSFVATPEEAAEDADFVQESAPERVELKRDLLAAASRAARPDVVFASSTSGLRPTMLQAAMERPERLTVRHPFNPVYLLPLVELCPGEANVPETLDRAAEVYGAVGMKPLRLEREIDGFIADRLLEALWREALWLVSDGVATVEEVDDAIRYGPGLRWSMMRTFLLYRIAGGEDGVKHFMAQFGPALQWPWTKLTDVPELTDELLEKLEQQSAAQAAGRMTRELERLRDDCLVSVLQALRLHHVGAGASLREWEEALLERAGRLAGDGDVPAAPLRLHETRVTPDWIDYNGHAHESSYLRLTGDATDALLRHVGVGADYLGAGGSYYTVETHLRHLREATAEEHLYVTTQVLGADEKRLHVFHRVARAVDDELLATVEQMLLHVDTEKGRAGPARPEVLARVRKLAEAHTRIPAPEGTGRHIELPMR